MKNLKRKGFAAAVRVETAAMLILALALFLAACTEKEALDLTHADFREIREASEGSTVSFYMWGGDAKINAWIDGFAADRLEEEYGITLKRVPMDASVFVNRLLNEKLAGKEEGIMDLFWINGENFRQAKEAGLLYGPFTQKLPSLAYCDPEEIAVDFGFPVEGFEAPYGKAQFVLEYDSAEIAEPPDTLDRLSAWVRENPGRFTYPRPPDFTGSAFIRQLFYLTTGGHEQYMAGFGEALYEEKAPALWDYLRSIKPYLWKEGETYPQGKSRLDLLFERGEVSFNMSYHQAAASGKILDGRYPPTVRTFVLQGASISNIHFTAIPFNSANKAGAVTVAEFLLSPEAQYSKNLPENWGDFTVLDLTRLPEEEADLFRRIDLGPATLPFEELARNAVPEIPAEYLERLEEDWEKELLHTP